MHKLHPFLGEGPFGCEDVQQGTFAGHYLLLRTLLEHMVPRHWQNVSSSVTLGSCSSFGSCCWESPDPASRGREQEGRGLLSSGGTTDSSETSLSCVNLPCAVDLLLVIRITMWLTAEARTQPTHMGDIWKYFCSPQGLLAVRTVGWRGRCNLYMDFERIAGEDMHPISLTG